MKRLALWGAVAVIGSAFTWGGVRYFDGTQAAAREYIAKEPTIVGRVGAVEDLTLYKLLYLDPKGSGDGCFADSSSSYLERAEAPIFECSHVGREPRQSSRFERAEAGCEI